MAFQLQGEIRDCHQAFARMVKKPHFVPIMLLFYFCSVPGHPRLQSQSSSIRESAGSMVWFMVMQVVSTLLEYVRLKWKPEQVKDLEILLLRRQLAIMERRLEKPMRLSRSEKLILAILAVKLKAKTGMSIKALGEVIRIVQPQTVIKWHRELVRRKWTFRHEHAGGRPRLDPAIEALVVRLAGESDWGYGKIQGELLKLGFKLSRETVANILRRQGLPPALKRQPSLTWRHLMSHYKDQLLACDFFTSETLFLKTVYVLVFIELGTRRVYFAGCTAHPNNGWVTQQARQMMWELEAQGKHIHALIHDNDRKFTSAFDTVFSAESIHVIHTPLRAPNANASMEHWVRSVREECLDKVLILNETHLRRVMREYINYYNTARPHQGLNQQIPIAQFPPDTNGTISRRNVLGGIIHDYYRKAA